MLADDERLMRDQLRARLAPVAAAQLGCNADEVVFAGGEARCGDKAIAWKDLVLQAWLARVGERAAWRAVQDRERAMFADAAASGAQASPSDTRRPCGARLMASDSNRCTPAPSTSATAPASSASVSRPSAASQPV